MKIDINLNALFESLVRALHRYHVVIFAIIALGGLATATFFLSRILTPAPTTSTATTATAFDTATINKLKSLRGSNDASTPLVKPAGRTNPFQ